MTTNLSKVQYKEKKSYRSNCNLQFSGVEDEKTQSKILHFINIFYSKSKYLRTTAWLAGQKFGTDLKQTYSIGRLKSFVTFT
jgi:hypothetical protein